jgi:hypothetical protein
MAQLDPRTGLPRRVGTLTRRRAAPVPHIAVPAGPPRRGIYDQPAGLPGSLVSQITTPGFTPDFNAIIAANPFLTQTRAFNAANVASTDAQAQEAIGQLVINLGRTFSPEDIAQQFGVNADFINRAINDDVRRLAAENEFSTLARLKREQVRGNATLQDMLAARGILQSGALGIGLQRSQEGFDEAQFDATNAALQQLRGLEAGRAAARREAGLSNIQALQQATEFESSQPQNQAIPGVTAKEVSPGVFQDLAGNTYDRFGNPIQAPPPPPPPTGRAIAEQAGVPLQAFRQRVKAGLERGLSVEQARQRALRLMGVG